MSAEKPCNIQLSSLCSDEETCEIAREYHRAVEVLQSAERIRRPIQASLLACLWLAAIQQCVLPSCFTCVAGVAKILCPEPRTRYYSGFILPLASSFRTFSSRSRLCTTCFTVLRALMMARQPPRNSPCRYRLRRHARPALAGIERVSVGTGKPVGSVR